MMATDKDEKPRDDDYPDIVPEDTRGDLALEAGALVANFLPGLGGAIANVLSGWSAERKRERVREVISGLALRLVNLQSEVADEYVRGDEFEDLLDQTLRRVANERHESKRRLYREFLVGAITKPATYDEQLRILRILEELQAAHIILLRAILQDPDPKHADGISGSLAATLARRMPAYKDQIDDLVAQLDDFRITEMSSSLKARPKGFATWQEADEAGRFLRPGGDERSSRHPAPAGRGDVRNDARPRLRLGLRPVPRFAVVCTPPTRKIARCLTPPNTYHKSQVGSHRFGIRKSSTRF